MGILEIFVQDAILDGKARLPRKHGQQLYVIIRNGTPVIEVIHNDNPDSAFPPPEGDGSESIGPNIPFRS